MNAVLDAAVVQHFVVNAAPWRVGLLGALLLAIFCPSQVLAQWRFEQRADPLGDGQIVVALVDAPDATMLVRCWTASTALDVRLSVRPELGPLVSEAVAVTFDDQPDQRAQWTLLPGGFGLEVPVAKRADLLTQMQRGSLMSVHVHNATDTTVRLRMPLIGSRQTIDSVLELCR